MNDKELILYIKEKILSNSGKIKSSAIRWGYMDTVISEVADKYGDSIYEKMYLFYFNKDRPVCKSCGKELKFGTFSKPYNTWCSNKCSSADPEVMSKSRAMKLEKYGNPFFSNLDKTKKTNIERYGVENVSQSDRIKDKKKQTTIKNYGVDHISKSNEIKNKKKKVLMEKYGVENISQLPEIKEKKRKTMYKNFNTVNGFDLCEDTMLKRYGVKYPAQIPEIHNKILKANGRKNKLKKISNTLHYQTNPELDCINHCIANNIKICDGPSIPYILDGKSHIYHVDFETDKYLIEIKGDHHWYKAAVISGKASAKETAAIKYAESINKKFLFLFNKNNNTDKFKIIIKENING